MTKQTVMDKKKVEINVSGLKMVKPPALSFKVVVELDKKMEKGAEKDPLLIQEFQNAAMEVYDQTVKTIEQKCKVFDKGFLEMASKGAGKSDLKKQLDGLNNAIRNDVKVAEKAAEINVAKAWVSLQKKKKEWTKFKIKIAVTIAGTLAGLAVSIAAMATSPFSGGAGAALGIIGFVKSGITLATEIGKIAISIDAAKKVVELNLKVVEATAKKTGVYVANEVSGAIFNEFVGTSQPTIKSTEGAADTLSAKYAQIVVKVHELSKVLNKILTQQDKMKKEFMADVDKRLKNHPAPNKTAQRKVIEKQLDDALGDNYAKVTDAIGDVQKMYADTVKWKVPVKTLKIRVKQLSMKDPKALKVFREGLKFASLALAPIDGNSVATTAKDLGMGLGGAVGGYAFDKISSKAIDGTFFDAA